RRVPKKRAVYKYRERDVQNQRREHERERRRAEHLEKKRRPHRVGRGLVAATPEKWRPVLEDVTRLKADHRGVGVRPRGVQERGQAHEKRQHDERRSPPELRAHARTISLAADGRQIAE